MTYDKIKDFSNDELSEKLDIALAKMKQSYKLLSILNRDYDIFLDIL
ncbi:hypothetical protein HOG21_02405 [bacterium]|nr:hypothetical protein [bacterium]